MDDVNQERPTTISVEEAAALLGVSRWAVYDAVNRGDIQAVRVGRLIRVAARPLEVLLGVAN
jgi:excisionase family DNA binding protein